MRCIGSHCGGFFCCLALGLMGFSSCGAWVLRGLWHLPRSGSNLCLQHWQADVTPLSHQETPAVWSLLPFSDPHFSHAQNSANNPLLSECFISHWNMECELERKTSHSVKGSFRVLFLSAVTNHWQMANK